MIGRRLDESSRRRADPARRAAVLECGAGLAARLGPVDFALRAGEILGFAGLEGSGVDESFTSSSGLRKPRAGEVIYARAAPPVRSPVAGDQAGVCACPGQSPRRGLDDNWSIRRNMTLVVLDRSPLLGFVDRRAERRVAEEYVRR